MVLLFYIIVFDSRVVMLGKGAQHNEVLVVALCDFSEHDQNFLRAAGNNGTNYKRDND